MAGKDNAQGPQDRSIPPGDREHGEGNYEATRAYNRDTKAFIDAGKVDEAARSAEPESDAKAEDLKKAEAEGVKRAKR